MPSFCAAVTIEILYTDASGVGFKDNEPLTEEQRSLLEETGNNAQTLGQARKNALEYAIGLLENKLTSSNAIRVEVSFSSLGQNVLASAGPKYITYFSSAPNIGYATALAENIRSTQLIDSTEAHIEVFFGEYNAFDYGLHEEGSSSLDTIDFATVAIHEIIHGLGFFSFLESDGSFHKPPNRQAQATTIYDLQMYSEREGDFIINLTQGERRQSATSNTDLLWDGTGRPQGNTACSYASRMTELKPDGAVSDGKPQLYSPTSFSNGSSISHVSIGARDIMEPFYPLPRDLDLSMGMLKDIGWNVQYDGFPPDCAPTGITVTPSRIVTTELGGEATFTVSLDSEPASNVRIPLRVSDPSEATISTNSLLFTTQNWSSAQAVNIRGVNDYETDGSQPYRIELGEAVSSDRFYNGYDPQDILGTNEEGLIVSPTTVNLNEGGRETFTVKLNAQPSENVTVNVSADNSDVTVNPSNLVFTTSDYGDAQTVTVSAAQDEDAEDETAILSIRITGGGQDLVVNIKDDDEKGLIVSPTTVNVNEGSRETFTVKLNAQPSENVTVNVSVDENNSDVTVNPSNLVFTTSNYGDAQTVTVSAAQDEDAEDETAILSIGITGGGQDFVINTAVVNVTVKDSAPSSSGGGGGCAIATTNSSAENIFKNGLLNWVLIVFASLSAILVRRYSSRKDFTRLGFKRDS